MAPTVDRFRALARSSPWRWTSLHLTRHGEDVVGTVEAWVDRSAGITRLRDADPLVQAERDQDPMYVNYQWVAMLRPVELSHDVELTDVVVTTRRGRETWTATAVPGAGYDPTCACCALLWCEVADRYEFQPDDYDRRWPEGRRYPESHRVSLDVETGVVVVLTPHGGDVAPWSVEIHEVDGPDPFS